MHVALYLKHFPPTGAPLNDGTATAVAGLAAGLAENGARVTVLCEGRTRSTVKTDRGYEVECFVNHRPYRTFALAPGLKRYVAERLAPQRALCLINGIFHPAVYGMGRWLHRLRMPYVVAPHDPYERAIFRSNAHLKWPYWYLFERTLLQRARAIQVLDMRHAACLRRLGIRTHAIETPNGFAADCVPAESQLQWRNPAQPAQFAFLGRLDAYNKGLDLLLEAFSRVAGQADAKLAVRGPDRGDRGRLEKLAAAMPAGDNIEFCDPDFARASTEIAGEYDVMCLPSRFEGFGLAALEAMLAGRVLLVSERAGIARHIEASGCGVTVPPTVDGIEKGMLALLRRRGEWREMGLSGRRHALRNLRWKDIAAAALHEYERLLHHDDMRLPVGTAPRSGCVNG